MRLVDISEEEKERSFLDIIKGAFHSFSRKPKQLSINSPYINGSIEGTEFVFRVTDEQSEITVFEGTVVASNDQGETSLTMGESVVALQGQAPSKRILINPRDEVNWGLYYPRILFSGDQSIDPQIVEIATLLESGRVDQARQKLEPLLSTGESGLAYALSSVINIALNQTGQALQDGTKAVELFLSPASLIALSYAQQSTLDLESARSSMQQANRDNPGNALVLARLAELNLMLGNISHAVELAEEAVSINDEVSNAQIVLGFTALALFDHEKAGTAFEKAILLDSANPLSHLGLGLSKINSGDLVVGRKDIEAAVALDSNDAVVRTYLGKSYFEEKRAPLDADQYAIAKQLDPNDPTAYLFDALRKHSENRPIEAVQDLQASIERNDNRAVYRGGNALDQDRAARGASLARIYDTLGFSKQGSSEASNSLAVDPANDSAHRFLSDSYRKIRRHEIARVSELLQAQMLQDINLNPVQPSVSATNLNIGSGAGDVGLNEFTGLFESNDIQPVISLMSGSNDTRATEAVISGVHDSLSFSLGGFDYKTDGWRDNNAQDQQLGNLFVQWAASPKLNLQAEISSRESTEGDLAFNFDPNDFDPTLTKEREQDTQRIGLRYSPSPEADLLVSHISSDRSERQTYADVDAVFNPLLPPPCDPVNLPFLCVELVPGDFDINREDDGTQSEIQYIHKFGQVNLVAGLSESEVESVINTATSNPTSIVAGTTELELSHSKTYLYSTFTLKQNIELTLGASKDEYESGSTDESVTNPKLGVIWKPDDRQTIRVAAFEVMKPALVNNRTLEPTQIAGFNQLFDDINATKTSRNGLGYDIKISHGLALGIELSERDMEEPVITNLGAGPVTIFEDREESYHRVYAHWTPTNSIAVSAEAIYDRYEAESGIITQDDNLPELVKTNSLPVSIKYFSPSGWYAGITTTFVDQEVQRDPFSSQASGEDSFHIVDLSIGYRLAKRRGAISLGVYNATDEQFMYQDDSYREFRDEPSIGPYFPERMVQIQASFVY
jgi:tetratricopeptide (TPR) repeat protein